MTTSIAVEVERRRRGKPKRERLTFRADVIELVMRALEQNTRIRFPSDRYRNDPVAFFREILGVEPWSKQVEIIEAVRDHRRVACRSGHRVSKSHTAAGLALWFYCSFPDARAIMSSTTDRQVNQILWLELKKMRARGGRCVDCIATDPDMKRIKRPCPHSALIDGEIGQLARTGLKSVDFREIVGFTAREAEAVQGIAGSNLLFILDEASGISDEIFQAIEGNRAGGAWVVLLGNPTRAVGEFHDAFHKKKEFYFTLTVSSEESPNVVAGRVVIPGLATREWIEEKKREWGEDSPLYKIRIKGEHVSHEEGHAFSVHVIELAEARWCEYDCDPCGGSGTLEGHVCAACGGKGRRPVTGRLFLGIDPAGATGLGDETAFTVRRGKVALQQLTFLGLNEDAILVHALSTLSAFKHRGEQPVVVIDREGPIGAKLYNVMHAHVDAQPDGAEDFELVALRASDRAVRDPKVYDRIRDELIGNLEAWFRDEGAIPEDVKLAAELHIVRWQQQVSGRLKITPKDDIRAPPEKGGLGRSPDRLDSLALACWEPLYLQDDLPPSAPQNERPLRDDDDDDDDGGGGGGGMDPYAGSGAWGGG